MIELPWPRPAGGTCGLAASADDGRRDALGRGAERPAGGVLALGRFERGADPNANEYALERAAQLVLELAGGELLKGHIDIYPKRIQPETVPLRPARCNHVLGTSLSPTSTVALLKKLNIKRVRSSKETILFRVPTYRPDLVREIDLIEEVARVFGYNNIDSQTIAPIDFDQRFDTSLPADALRTGWRGSVTGKQ